MKIAFLIAHAYGMGGTIRTVTTLANQLCDRHDVELISVNRAREHPFFSLDPRVRLRPLHDHFDGGEGGWLRRVLSSQPSLLMHKRDRAYSRFSLWGDLRALQVIRNLDADVLVGTRPALSLLAARWAPDRVVKVAQEHSHVFSHHQRVRRAMRQLYPRLDCVVSLTPAGARDMDAVIGEAGVRRPMIPNSIDTADRPISTQQNKLVVAAGRLAPGKQHKHLVTAFARVVERHPDWKLRIYGAGACQDALRRQIFSLDLYNHVFLMGQCDCMDREFARASISVMSSRREALGMSILESMACGVPVVSYDCDHGPRSIITSGEDGLLVRNGSPRALAKGIIDLIEDESKRRVMGKSAIDTASAYDQRVIARRWEELFEDLVAAKRRR